MNLSPSVISVFLFYIFFFFWFPPLLISISLSLGLNEISDMSCNKILVICSHSPKCYFTSKILFLLCLSSAE